MTDDFWQLILTQSARRAQHVGHSLRMVGALPMACESATTATEQTACLESWLMHVRLLAEFLLVHPSHSTKDFSAKDFDWDGQTSIDTSEIEQLWLVASQHLVHFSRERTPENVYTFEQIAADWDTPALQTMASNVFDLAEEFVAHLERDDRPEASAFRHDLDQAVRALRP